MRGFPRVVCILVLGLALAVGYAWADIQTTVSLEQVSAKAKEAIQKQVQGAGIKEIEQETMYHKTVYYVWFVKDGKEEVFFVTPEGAVVEATKRGEKDGNVTVLDFDKEPTGSLPAGWKAGTTRPGGPSATWEIVADPKAPSGKQVLSLTKINHNASEAFNLCWTDQVKFKDGTLEVRMRSNTGQEDQGGGLIWRVKDENNYYVCRYNPLEENYRLYVVKDGKRKQIAGADGIKIPAGEWVELRVTQKGGTMVSNLNGKVLLRTSDPTFPDTGGVGFWTKADAATSFDFLEVEGAEK